MYKATSAQFQLSKHFSFLRNWVATEGQHTHRSTQNAHTRRTRGWLQGGCSKDPLDWRVAFFGMGSKLSNGNGFAVAWWEDSVRSGAFYCPQPPFCVFLFPVLLTFQTRAPMEATYIDPSKSSPPADEPFFGQKTVSTQTSTPPPQPRTLSPPKTPPLSAQDEEAAKKKHQARLVLTGEFEPEHHFYPRVLNAQIHPLVQSFLTLGNERIIARYTHLNPQVKAETLREVLSYKPKFFQWAGK